MTTTKPLSTAAQRVRNFVVNETAFKAEQHQQCLDAAVALRAAAPYMEFVQDHRKLQSIATELEGHHG